MIEKNRLKAQGGIPVLIYPVLILKRQDANPLKAPSRPWAEKEYPLEHTMWFLEDSL